MVRKIALVVTMVLLAGTREAKAGQTLQTQELLLLPRIPEAQAEETPLFAGKTLQFQEIEAAAATDSFACTDCGGDCGACYGCRKKWRPIFDAQYWQGEQAFSGGDLMLPIWQDQSSLMFLDSGIWYSDDNSEQYDIGVVHRKQVDGCYIQGAYVFYNFNNTAWDNHFHGATVGFEMLSENHDFRINGYFVDDDTEEVSQLNRALFDDGDIFVRQGLEGAYNGLDVEAGTRLWQFGSNCMNEVRGYIGGFYFDSPTSSFEDIAGPRTRLEMRCYDLPLLGAGSRLTLGGEYRWDDVRGSEGFFTVGLQVPLGALHKFRRQSNCRNDCCGVPYLDRRMMDPVIRERMVTAVALGPRERAINLKNDQIIDAAQIVRAGDDAESITEGLGPNSVAIFDGTDGQIDVAATIDVNAGQTVLGGGSQLAVQGDDSGAIATFTAPGSRPMIVNDTTNDPLFATADGASGVLFSGLDIKTRQDNAIAFDFGQDSSNFCVTDVTIQTLGQFAPGFDIEGNNDDFGITDVTMVTRGENSPGFEIDSGNTDFSFDDVMVTTFDDDSPAFDIESNNTDFSFTGVTTQTWEGGSPGFDILDGNMRFSFTDLDVSTAEAYRFDINVSDSAGDGFRINDNNSDFTFTDITVLTEDSSGRAFQINDNNMGFSFTGINIETNDSKSDGFGINNGNDNFSFTDVVIQTNDSKADGFDIEMNNTNFTFTGITIDTNDNSAYGFGINTGNSNFSFTDIMVDTDDRDADGFEIAADNSFFSFTNVEIHTEEARSHGFEIGERATNFSFNNVHIQTAGAGSGETFGILIGDDDFGDDDFMVVSDGGSNFSFTNVTIHNFGDGDAIRTRENSTNFSFEDVIVEGLGGGGIVVEDGASSFIFNNVSARSGTYSDGGGGIGIGSNSSDFTFTNVTAEGNDTHGGIEIRSNNDNFSFTNVTAEGNDSGDGIAIEHNNTNFTFNNVTSSGDDSGGGFEIGDGNDNFSFTDIIADGDDTGGAFDIHDNNTNFTFNNITATADSLVAIDVGDGNSDFSFTDVDVTSDNGPLLEIGTNNSMFSVTNLTGTTFGDGDDTSAGWKRGGAADAISILDTNTNFTFTNIDVTTNGYQADGFRINDDNSDFSFNDVDIKTCGNEADGFDVNENNTNFTFNDVDIETNGNSAHGIDVNTGHSGFDLDNVSVSTEGDGANGIVLLNGSSFSLDNSTFDGLRDGDVLDFTNVTGLSGTGNTAQNFGGVLFNDRGGNTGAITFPFVDADGDGVNEGPVTIP